MPFPAPGDRTRQVSVVPSGTDGVVPTLSELVALRGVAQARHVARRGRLGISGPAPSMQRGRGMEYAESREYAQGDDARHIDWRLTARSGRMHTKLFHAERERLSLIVADTSPDLFFGTRVRFKSVQAARAGAVAAWAALRDGDRIAALRGGGADALVPPAGGPRGVLRVLDALVRWYAAPPDDDTGLTVALDRARRLLRPGARLLVLADAGSVARVPPQTWPSLTGHHEVVVLLIDDPIEREPPAQRLPLLSAGRRMEPDLSSAAQRRRWEAAFPGAARQAADMLRARGARVDMLSADAPSESWLPQVGRR
ncbi:DUF58 domain-containing protein [Luteimonas saliphila]|uniref:DUF58 domain-containing protein n=1 Tax=Luteimonas saliphila TaxID=2804919 RepID=UPI001EE1B5D6|nr:DUF58 domain-containing protein [Luteimonas saliphila]